MAAEGQGEGRGAARTPRPLAREVCGSAPRRGCREGRGPWARPTPLVFATCVETSRGEGPFKRRAQHPSPVPRRASFGEQWGATGGWQPEGLAGGRGAAIPWGRCNRGPSPRGPQPPLRAHCTPISATRALSSPRGPHQGPGVQGTRGWMRCARGCAGWWLRLGEAQGPWSLGSSLPQRGEAPSGEWVPPRAFGDAACPPTLRPGQTSPKRARVPGPGPQPIGAGVGVLGSRLPHRFSASFFFPRLSPRVLGSPGWVSPRSGVTGAQTDRPTDGRAAPAGGRRPRPRSAGEGGGREEGGRKGRRQMGPPRRWRCRHTGPLRPRSSLHPPGSPSAE